MNYKSQTIHIAVAFDQNYLHPFYALITSLFQNNPEINFNIHAISTGISDLEREKIQKYIKEEGSEIFVYSIDASPIQDFKLTSNWTHAVYYRLFLPLLVPTSVDRLLYLDSDTIVIGKISSLFDINLEEYPLAAVYDNYVKAQPLLNINLEGEYFNSGVLLIDVKKWRQQKVSERAMEYLAMHPERILYVDQCALNAVLFKNWKKIDSKYNLLYSYLQETISKTELNTIIKNIVIVHFTLQRPWNMLCKNRLRSFYYYYLAKSPVGKRQYDYVDFEWNKIPAWVKIRLLEFYFDQPLLQWLWRRSKLV